MENKLINYKKYNMLKKMIKKVFYIVGLFIFVLVFASCKIEATTVNFKDLPVRFELPTQGPDEKNAEPADNYKQDDVSEIKFADRPDGTIYTEKGIYHIKDTDGSGSNRNINWVLNSNYTQYNACGFSICIKINENMNYAGVQLFKKNSYDNYQFDVCSDGSFVIRENVSKSKKYQISANESHIDLNKFNRITVRNVDSGDVQIFVNGYLVKQFVKEELKFDLSSEDKIAVEYNVLKSASERIPARAWYKIEQLQRKK